MRSRAKSGKCSENSDSKRYNEPFFGQSEISVTISRSFRTFALGALFGLFGALSYIPTSAFAQSTGGEVASVQTASIGDVASINPKPAESTAAAPKKPRAVKRRLSRSAPSVAALAGLRETPDPLELSSSVAYMVDQDTGEVYFEKNAGVQLPIASVTKLMTALVIAESELSLKTPLTVTRADYVRSTAESVLRAGMTLTRGDTLRAALMSSDNRAAHMLARTYPGGVKAFVAKMNETAQELGMVDSHFADPTGLSNKNVSTARDLTLLASRAHSYRELQKASTSATAVLDAGTRKLHLMTTNRLIGDPRWHVGIQKTGYTRAAGRCMVVQSEFAGHRVVMVVLDSVNSSRRADDMYRMRRWLEEETRFEAQFAQTSPFELL